MIRAPKQKPYVFHQKLSTIIGLAFLAREVEVLEFRSNNLEAVAEVASNVAIVGVNPPVDDARVSQELISRKNKVRSTSFP